MRIRLALCLLLPLVAAAEDAPLAEGLVVAPGAALVSRHCTVCHGARLVIQNRADRAGWQTMIRWMQETQGLWPLGDDEEPILDYLAAHYGPTPQGRRAPLPPALLPPR
ncbi:hypothetical protein [Pseudohaliea sp.]|uniref:hypothetical protein n=1 Tax=Pseudohaliea sp. TaxID=2740289 RepID=UPI0032ECD9C9